MGAEKKISRRGTLVAASGLLMIGSGLGAVLVARDAHAAEGPKFLIKVHKQVGKKKKLIGTIELPDDLLEKLQAAGEGTLKLGVETGSDKQSKLLGEKAIADAPKLKQAVKNARKKKIKSKHAPKQKQ